jgi:hypothetical protein
MAKIRHLLGKLVLMRSGLLPGVLALGLLACNLSVSLTPPPPSGEGAAQGTATTPPSPTAPEPAATAALRPTSPPTIPPEELARLVIDKLLAEGIIQNEAAFIDALGYDIAEQRIIEVYQRVSPSVVNITTQVLQRSFFY